MVPMSMSKDRNGKKWESWKMGVQRPQKFPDGGHAEVNIIKEV